MITFSWNIKNLERTSATDIITTVDWEYIGKNENGIKSSVSNSCVLPDPDINNFIEYNSITKEQIIIWLESLVDISYYADIIEDAINNIINPSIVRGLPWDNN